MTTLTHESRSFSSPLSTTAATTRRLDPAFVVVGLFSLLGLCLSAVALLSGASANLEAIVPFLG
jgi:hypothetical protein